MDSKDTNPKDAVGTRKTPGFSVVPQTVIAELSLALLEGARKYGRHNYRATGVRASVYMDATWGHMSDFWEGEDIDPDSRLLHVTKAFASLAVLLDSILQDNWIDDRPPRATKRPRKDNDAKAAEIIDRVRPDDPVPPYTEAGMRMHLTEELHTSGFLTDESYEKIKTHFQGRESAKE